MRVICGFVLCLMLATPGVAKAQSLELFGSAGPTIVDAGHSLAVGAGFSPHSRLTLVFTFDRTHLDSTTSYDDGVISDFRGGTLYLGAAELRVFPFKRDRFGPYGLAGLATGRSRPNVTPIFPTRVTNFVAGVFMGGGVHAPVGERLSVFADFRMLLGGEGREGMVATAPLRAGMSWRF
jgi:hypothetical protein